MKLSASASRLKAATEALIARSDEIKALADDPEARVSEIFSRKEIAVTCSLSIDFMLAVAETKSIDDIRVLRSTMEDLQDHVIASDEAVADRIQENPLVITGLMNAEQTLFRMLIEADPTIRVGAGFAKDHVVIVRSVFTAVLTDIRHQLEVHEGARPGRLARMSAAVTNGLGSLINRKVAATFARYAEETKKEVRATKKELMKAYQSSGESVETLSGPRTPEKRDQVRKVIIHIASAEHPVEIADACNATFKSVPGGYSTAHDLYVWCHRNEAKIMRLVDDLRLA